MTTSAEGSRNCPKTPPGGIRCVARTLSPCKYEVVLRILHRCTTTNLQAHLVAGMFSYVENSESQSYIVYVVPAGCRHSGAGASGWLYLNDVGSGSVARSTRRQGKLDVRPLNHWNHGQGVFDVLFAGVEQYGRGGVPFVVQHERARGCLSKIYDHETRGKLGFSTGSACEGERKIEGRRCMSSRKGYVRMT